MQGKGGAVKESASREMAKMGYAHLPDLCKKHKVKVTGNYHFDSEHLAIMIVEARSAESVRDMLVEAGFMHWCNLRVYPIYSRR